MSTSRPDKRLIRLDELQLPEEDDSSLLLDEQPGLAGVACAWLCLLVCALYLLVVIARYAWVAIAG